MYAGFLDLAQPLQWSVDGALDVQTCAAYVARFPREGAEVGTVIGREGEIVDLQVRNNTRVMWDDEAEAQRLFERVAPHVPPVLRMGGVERRVVGANPRLRVYRYQPGQKHGAHWDTEVELPDGRRSLLTLVFYLNDGFEGGCTEFPELGATVQPQAGRALLFQQRVVHVAGEVTRGTKYVLRTDLMYSV